MSQEISAQAETKLGNGQSTQDGEHSHVYECDQFSYSETPLYKMASKDTCMSVTNSVTVKLHYTGWRAKTRA